jgi:hypothetical protein
MDIESDELLKRAYDILGLHVGAPLADAKRARSFVLESESRNGEDWDRIKEIERAYETIAAYFLLQKEEVSQDKRLGTGEAKTFQEGCTLRDRLRDSIFPPVDENVNPFYFWGRLLFFAFILIWGFKFIFAPIKGDYIGRSFMHLINLPFHEAGHLIFSIFGDFIRVLGGTLMQILIPLVCMAAFLQRSDAFAGSVALWWTGQSLIDVAPYIFDARAGELMLLGGMTGQDAPDFHDWHNMLGRLGLLSYDHAIAYTVKYMGAALILLALVWAGYTLLSHYRRLTVKQAG